MNKPTIDQGLARWLQWVLAAALLVACTTPPPPVPQPPVPPPVLVVPQPPAPPPAPVVKNDKVSNARTPRDYRGDAARHLYACHKDRIFVGRMPPLLHAIGVLQVDINAQGDVTRISWMRAPSHAPDVIAEIERKVRQAAPYPAPVRMGRVTYTDTWLWDKSGKFQLDTLTEGQQ